MIATVTVFPLAVAGSFQLYAVAPETARPSRRHWYLTVVGSGVQGPRVAVRVLPTRGVPETDGPLAIENAKGLIVTVRCVLHAGALGKARYVNVSVLLPAPSARPSSDSSSVRSSKDALPTVAEPYVTVTVP